jgi:hypothetical protein
MNMNYANSKSNQLPPGALELVERWRIQTIPESEEHERQLKIKPDSTTITVHEHLGTAGDAKDQIRRPIAKLCYRPQEPPSRAWSLFCADQNDDWYRCEDFLRPSFPFAGSLVDALAEITEDRDGRFFGTF